MLQGKTLFKLLCFSFLGGWASGALGLSGSSIYSPLLLSLGVPPKVVSSSSMYMVMFAAFSSTLAYGLNGSINWSYAIWCGSFCIIGSIAGMSALDALMKRLNRQSVLVFLLVSIFYLSTISVPYVGIK